MEDASCGASERQFPSGMDDAPPGSVVARPAATLLLMRDEELGFTVLLLKRTHNAGFVPGAYVFPGGRVDGADLDSDVLARARGLTWARAAERMRLHDANPPAAAYYSAALREAFEETGILVGRTGDGDSLPTAAASPGVREVRDKLLRGACSFAQALEDLDVFIDNDAIEYIGHWITPVGEPRRYDTRFFAAAVGPRSEPALHIQEVLKAIWLRPAEALDLARDGSLPMVFPTIKTLESVSEFATTSEVLQAFRSRRVPSVRPRLVRAPNGALERTLEVISD